ncbi:MAG: hypothetical protein PHC64_01940 [Candidatus Gastranaerophilales bacterium]|nr:hypothetical protein [Candidatus Gastranaerophilales bacterium]
MKNFKNQIDFFLRQYLGFSRKNYSEKNESKEGLFAQQKALEREQYLLEKFGLETLKSNSTRQNYLENLYTVDLLERFFELEFRDNLTVLDIGCKNWCYARGEYFFFKRYCKNLILDGIEIDSNRLYTNFYNRREVAKFHIKDLKGAKYISKDFLRHDRRYNYIMWFLPFIIKEPMQKWGLPDKYFQPEKMLSHAYELLNSGGNIFVVNQGLTEYNVQKGLCQKLNIPFILLGEVKSEFLNYEIPMFAMVLNKN